MESSPELIPQLSPSEVVGIADAMDERSQRNIALGRQVEAELMGVPYVESPKVLRDAQSLARTALLMSYVADPNQTFNFQDMAAVSEQGGWALEVEASRIKAVTGHEGPTVDTMRRHRDDLILAISSTGLDGERLAQEMRRDLRACQAVAEANGVNIVEVFAADSLYCEAMRQEYPVAEHFETASLVIGAIEASAEARLVNSMTVQELGAEEAATYTDEEKLELTEILRAEPDFEETVEQYSFMTSEIFRQILYVSTGRTYGTEAYDEITPEQHEKVLPRLPLTNAAIAALAAA